jgi:hypothetical protein
MFAIARHQHIIAVHRARHSDRHRLLAERRGKGPEAAGALQRDSLGVERSGTDQRRVETAQPFGVIEARRQCRNQDPFDIEGTGEPDRNAGSRFCHQGAPKFFSPVACIAAGRMSLRWINR